MGKVLRKPFIVTVCRGDYYVETLVMVGLQQHIFETLLLSSPLPLVREGKLLGQMCFVWCNLSCGTIRYSVQNNCLFLADRNALIDNIYNKMFFAPFFMRIKKNKAENKNKNIGVFNFLAIFYVV